MELKEGTGPITAACSCGSFLEIYKQDITFRIRTPEAIDPEELNPNAPWVASPVANVGSSNLSVARVLLQAHEMLNAAMFERNLDKEAITIHLHTCKEALIACEKLATQITDAIDGVVKQVEERGVDRDNRGRGFNPFPQVQDLDLNCGSFLTQANRAIKLLCELPTLFIDLERPDSNFDHLGKRLSEKLGEASPIATFVRENADTVRYLIDLRNFHEHPKKIRTVVENFRMLPDVRIQPPVWYLEGQGVPDPHPIRDEVGAAVDFLRDVAEAMFIHLVMHSVTKKFPYIIQQVPEEEIASSLPIRYRLSVDMGRVHVQGGSGARNG